jgi:hypothetical protein
MTQVLDGYRGNGLAWTARESRQVIRDRTDSTGHRCSTGGSSSASIGDDAKALTHGLVREGVLNLLDEGDSQHVVAEDARRER